MQLRRVICICSYAAVHIACGGSSRSDEPAVDRAGSGGASDAGSGGNVGGNVSAGGSVIAGGSGGVSTAGGGSGAIGGISGGMGGDAGVGGGSAGAAGDSHAGGSGSGSGGAAGVGGSEECCTVHRDGCQMPAGGTYVACFAPFDGAELREAGCIDQGTQIPSYCCPSDFVPRCTP